MRYFFLICLPVLNFSLWIVQEEMTYTKLSRYSNKNKHFYCTYYKHFTSQSVCFSWCPSFEVLLTIARLSFWKSLFIFVSEKSWSALHDGRRSKEMRRNLFGRNYSHFGLPGLHYYWCHQHWFRPNGIHWPRHHFNM